MAFCKVLSLGGASRSSYKALQGEEKMRVRIGDINVDKRIRKEMGDISSLAESIRDRGLLQPIAITQDKKLISGMRRIQAAKELGWTEIEAHVVDLDAIIYGERDENVLRKDFSPSELVDLANVIEIYEAEKARERQLSGLKHQKKSDRGAELGTTIGKKGKTRDKVSRILGVSHDTLRKAQAVVEAAKSDPKNGDLVEMMDETNNVHSAFVELKKRLRKAEIAVKALSAKSSLHHRVIHAD